MDNYRAVKFDVVVVGGGPAGTSTARFLAKKGVKVLIIEKRKLPRFKLCAGCLSARIAPLLPRGWESEILNTIRGGFLGFRGQRFHHRVSSEPVAYIVDRKSFDFFLVESASREGVEVWEETEFIEFEDKGRLYVRTNRGGVETDFIVGADGFYTKVGRQLGYKKDKFFRSIEFWADGDLREEVVIDIGVVKRGYGWIFPKGDKVSVGLATVGRGNLLKALKVYVNRHRFLDGVSVNKVMGWMIPFAISKEDLHLGRDRVFLVGDAANMVDPLLGEGIYYGVAGGKLLADSLVQDTERALESYKRNIEEKILPELYYAGKIAKLAYTFQKTAYRMGGGRALDRFLDLLSGERSYKDLYRKGLMEFVISLLHFENFSHIIIDKILRRR